MYGCVITKVSLADACAKDSLRLGFVRNAVGMRRICLMCRITSPEKLGSETWGCNSAATKEGTNFVALLSSAEGIGQADGGDGRE